MGDAPESGDKAVLIVPRNVLKMDPSIGTLILTVLKVPRMVILPVLILVMSDQDERQGHTTGLAALRAGRVLKASWTATGGILSGLTYIHGRS